MPRLKIIYMGTPPFATLPLKALAEDKNFEILAVVTRPDKKTGRKQLLTPTAVKVAALEEEIPVLEPETFKNNPPLVELLKKMKPDFFVVVAYGKILPQEVLKIPRLGSINIHPSLLPQYRGPSPMAAAIADGKTETGITFMLLEEQMDAGPVVFIERAEITPQDTTETLCQKLFLRASILLPAVLLDYADGNLPPLPQNESKATYSKKFTREDGLLDPLTMTAVHMVNLVRAYAPHCFLEVDGKKLKVLEASASPVQSPTATSLASTSLPARNSSSSSSTASHSSSAPPITHPSFKISTKEGFFVPLKVQLEGKNATSIADFARGNALLLSKIPNFAR